MKTKLFFLAALFLATLTFAQTPAKVVKSSFTVYGNCAICKKRIETALDHNGIKQSQWDARTKVAQVVYNPAKITELQIHQLIASAGHDTDKVRATDEAYTELPYCCLYRQGSMDELKRK